MKNKLAMYAAAACLLCSCGSQEMQRFRTDYFGLDIDAKGYIVGMWNTTRESRNFSPADRPSPLLALYDGRLKRYYYPQKARYANGKYRLEYANGSIATVRLEEKDKYFKLTLEALDNREGISGIQWGNYYTNINNLLGDIIGVARDTTAAVNYAIGVLALDDNTIGGESLPDAVRWSSQRRRERTYLYSLSLTRPPERGFDLFTRRCSYFAE